TTDSFSDTGEAVEAIAASGHTRSADVVQALQDGRLLFDAASKKVYIKTPAGAVTDAETGAAVASPPASLSTVRLNNRLRRPVEAAMGSLTLLSPDPAKRIEAAQPALKTRDPNALPIIDGALAKETHAGAKRAFTEAR